MSSYWRFNQQMVPEVGDLKHDIATIMNEENVFIHLGPHYYIYWKGFQQFPLSLDTFPPSSMHVYFF